MLPLLIIRKHESVRVCTRPTEYPAFTPLLFPLLAHAPLRDAFHLRRIERNQLLVLK